MKKAKLRDGIVPTLILCLLSLLALSSATFAWFTANRQVGTSRVEARAATEEVQLLFSSTGGEDFRGAETAEILQRNETNLERLLPVSTVDLKNFVYCPATPAGGYATGFKAVENEAYYYHGRFYMMATVTGAHADAVVSVYLDESADNGGILAEAGDDSLLLHAARLGLVLNEDDATRVILRLSDEQNDDAQRRIHTQLDGVLLEENMVIESDGAGNFTAAEDPSRLLSAFLPDAQSGALPEKPLFTLTPGTIYPVDVYFYLEGCDPDCTEALERDDCDLHIAFFGVLG